MSPSIEQRLAALESQNRTQRRALALVMGMLAATTILGLTRRDPPPKEVASQAFTLVDEAGRTLATLSSTEHGPRLQFLDEKGKPRVSMGFDPDHGPIAALLDDSGYLRVGLAVTSEGAGVQLRDAGNKDRVTLAQCVDCASLSVQDENGVERAGLGFKTRRSFAHVSNELGGGVSLMSTKRSTELALRDDKRIDRVRLMARPESAGLDVSDPTDHGRVSVFQSKDCAAVYLYGEHKEDRVALAQMPENSGLFISDAKHPRRLTLAASAESAGLEVFGSTDRAQLEARVDGVRPYMRIADETDRIRASMMMQDRYSAVAVYSGDTRAAAYLDASGPLAELGARDAEGKVVSSLPPATSKNQAQSPFQPNAGPAPKATDSPKVDLNKPAGPKPDDSKLDLSPSGISPDKPR